jgi:hypothetical protein
VLSLSLSEKQKQANPNSNQNKFTYLLRKVIVMHFLSNAPSTPMASTYVAGFKFGVAMRTIFHFDNSSNPSLTMPLNQSSFSSI